MIKTNTLKITPEILAIIAELEEFKGQWQLLSMLAPERLSALQRVATIESIGSSTRIEGSRLSDKEIAQLLQQVTAESFSSRDAQEVAGYADVMQTIFRAWSDIPINENHIKQLHRDLLRYSEKDNRHRGEYKKSSNNVAAFDKTGKQIGIIFETATPFDTPRFMRELISWFVKMRDTKQLHALILIAIFVVVFLEIHPFQDGNGRLSRVLTTLLLLQSGYLYVPYSSLESVIEHNKESYYVALRQTQTTIRTEKPNWQTWLIFFLRSLQKQKQQLAAKIEREKLLLNTLPDIALQIIEYAQQHGRVTINELVQITHANRNTLKVHLRKLVRDRHLILHGSGKGAWYSLL